MSTCEVEALDSRLVIINIRLFHFHTSFYTYQLVNTGVSVHLPGSAYLAFYKLAFLLCIAGMLSVVTLYWFALPTSSAISSLCLLSIVGLFFGHKAMSFHHRPHHHHPHSEVDVKNKDK